LGIEPALALFAGIGLVLVPLEVGYLSAHARLTTGSWSPLQAVGYKTPISGSPLLVAGLVAWFLLALGVSVAVLDEWLIENVFAWMPEGLRELATTEEDGESASDLELVALLLLALAFNGVAGPVAEELYFRGHLLPRLERYGTWAPVINTVLFAIYHFFSPWRYPAIVIGFLPITWAVWRRQSIYVSIAAHMAINMITVLLLVAAIASGE
jgi:membrane protease YdiL (CAAX protease family)